MLRARLKFAGVCLILLMVTPGAWAKDSSASLDPDYPSALAAADHFLQAWQSNDAENGIAVLTAHAKKNVSRDALERFFASGERSAYEINHGKRVRRGRYEFPVVLVTRESNRLHRKFSAILIVNTGGNDWAVDKLP
jgi:hypothetical protein